MAESVDVVVIGHNEAPTLPKSLCAARAAIERLQEVLGMPTTLVYVDSQSIDDSVSIAHRNGARVVNAPGGFRTPSNARNTGLWLTRGTYVMFLDGDMEIDQDWLVAGVRFLRESPRAAGVAGKRDDVRLTKWGQRRIMNYYGVGKHVSTVGTQVGGACLFRRRALEEIGGFEPDLGVDEEFFAYLCLRECGWELFRIPVPMVVHWDWKLRSLSSIIGKLVVGRFTLLPGAFLRHAVFNSRHGWRVAQFYADTLGHVLFVGVLAATTIVSWAVSLAAIAYIALVAGCVVVYLRHLVRMKHGWYRAVMAAGLLNVRAVNLIIGFVLNKPKVRYGLRFSEAYRARIRQANGQESEEN